MPTTTATHQRHLADRMRRARVPIQPIANLADEDAAASRIAAALYGRAVRRLVEADSIVDDFMLL